MTLRPAHEGDVSRIGEIAETTDLFPAEMLDDMIAGYLDASKPDIWFVAVDDDGPVGFGFCEPERMTEGTWNLLAIGVLPAHQNRGVGAAMLRYLEDLLRQREARILLVETLGTAEFERTRDFYRRNGYGEEARIRDFYTAGGDKVIFRKAL